MILDNTNILWEGALGAENGKVVALTSMKIPGKMNPVPVYAGITKALTGSAQAVKLKFMQSDDGNAWEEVDGGTFTLASEQFSEVGRIQGLKYLPRTVTKQFLKMEIEQDGGTLDEGEIFVALTREDPEPMEAGLYIDKGHVVG